MDINNSLYSPLPPWEQMSESYHWSIKFGELILPPLENTCVEAHTDYMGVYLRFLFNLYIHTLSTSNYSLSKKIISSISRLGDPYMPGICAEAGLFEYEHSMTDVYLDEIDL